MGQRHDLKVKNAISEMGSARYTEIQNAADVIAEACSITNDSLATAIAKYLEGGPFSPEFEAVLHAIGGTWFPGMKTSNERNTP